MTQRKHRMMNLEKFSTEYLLKWYYSPYEKTTALTNRLKQEIQKRTDAEIRQIKFEGGE